MTVIKKGYKKIVINNSQYLWKTTVDRDYWIVKLIIAGENRNGQVLITYFPLFSKFVGPDCEEKSNGYVKQLMIAPYTVRLVIEHALQDGWRPDKAGKPFHLSIEGKIEHQLKET
jgi:hypothetical protein